MLICSLCVYRATGHTGYRVLDDICGLWYDRKRGEISSGSLVLAIEILKLICALDESINKAVGTYLTRCLPH